MRAHAVEERPEQTRSRDRPENAERDASENERKTLSQNQAEHRPSLRSQRHSDPDLARPLRRDVSHHPIKPYHRQQQRPPAKTPSITILKRRLSSDEDTTCSSV